MDKHKRLLIVGCIAVCFIIGGIGTYALYQNQLKVEAKAIADHKTIAKREFASLFSDKELKVVKLDISNQQVKKAETAISKLEKGKLKKNYQTRIRHIRLFMKHRDEIDSLLPNGILKSDTGDDKIAKLQKKYQKLEPGFQTVLKDRMDMILNQHQAIKDLDTLIRSFFDKEIVKDTVDAESFAKLKALLKDLPQRDIADQYASKVALIQSRLDELEEQERIRVEAERQAAIARALAESERLRKENEAIQAANVIIPNVPLIDQSINVHNGCEVASLLMGLQHFGINSRMTLVEIANAVPKSNNPHTGFVLDIFTLFPRDRAHWIAPDALAAFGQTYHGGVANISGSNVEQLKAEIDAGNPVIVYATYGFAYPRAWDGEVPVNMHVMLMVGYNKITGNIIINEPWGGKQIIVGADTFAREYNRRQYAVAIRP